MPDEVMEQIQEQLANSPTPDKGSVSVDDIQWEGEEKEAAEPVEETVAEAPPVAEETKAEQRLRIKAQIMEADGNYKEKEYDEDEARRVIERAPIRHRELEQQLAERDRIIEELKTRREQPESQSPGQSPGQPAAANRVALYQKAYEADGYDEETAQRYAQIKDAEDQRFDKLVAESQMTRKELETWKQQQAEAQAQQQFQTIVSDLKKQREDFEPTEMVNGQIRMKPEYERVWQEAGQPNLMGLFEIWDRRNPRKTAANSRSLDAAKSRIAATAAGGSSRTPSGQQKHSPEDVKAFERQFFGTEPSSAKKLFKDFIQ